MSDGGVALVTGGLSGIGLAIARALAKSGFRVAVLDKAAAEGDAVRDELVELGAPAAVVERFDLADLASHDAALNEVERRLGGPAEVLVNNAGVPAQVRGDLLGVAPDAFDAVLSVNLRGTFFLTQNVARRMVGRQPADPGRSRAIVAVSSVSAAMASVERGDYCLSKAALPMLVRLFALRLAPHGIGVFEVRPGIIRTPMTAGVSARYDALIAEGLVPAGRWGEPEDVAQVVSALATGAFRFATGSVITADGGLSIQRL